MTEKLILLGGGSHCKVVVDAIRAEGRFDLVGIVEADGRETGGVSGVLVIGCDSDLARISQRGIRKAFIAVGSTGDCSKRVRLYENLQSLGYGLPVIAHPSATISDDSRLSDGVFVAAGAVVNPCSEIGVNAIINTGAVVEHDCEIGRFVHVSPGAIMGGGVTVGEFSHIGIGAVVREDIHIGRNTIIGAGSVVISDIGDNVIAYGSPCKVEREK